jgi:hypothetical protein
MSEFRIPTGKFAALERPTNGDAGDEAPHVERRDGHVSIPSKWLWPALVLLLGGNGAGIAGALGFVPAASPSPPVADERMATTIQRVSALETELSKMRATAERTERNLVRIAERLHVRDVERP